MDYQTRRSIALDTAGISGLDLIEFYQRGVKGKVYVSRDDMIKDARFMPVRDSKGKKTGEEVHQGNLYKSQAEADSANEKIKKAWGR